MAIESVKIGGDEEVAAAAAAAAAAGPVDDGAFGAAPAGRGGADWSSSFSASDNFALDSFPTCSADHVFGAGTGTGTVVAGNSTCESGAGPSRSIRYKEA